MPVAFDTSGMEQYDERTWFDPRTGDQVSLTYIGMVPDLPAGLDEVPLLRHRLALETAEVGALIEAHVVTVDTVPTLFQLLKVPIPNQETGQAFIAAFTVPKATCSAVLRIQCAEDDARAGAREAAVFGQVGADVRPHPYAPGVTGLLPWHVADDAQWDGQFPDHPLTRARAWAHRMIATARIDPEFARLPPFRPAAGGVTEMFPKLVPVPDGGSWTAPDAEPAAEPDVEPDAGPAGEPVDVPPAEAQEPRLRAVPPLDAGPEVWQVPPDDPEPAETGRHQASLDGPAMTRLSAVDPVAGDFGGPGPVPAEAAAGRPAAGAGEAAAVDGPDAASDPALASTCAATAGVDLALAGTGPSGRHAGASPTDAPAQDGGRPVAAGSVAKPAATDASDATATWPSAATPAGVGDPADGPPSDAHEPAGGEPAVVGGPPGAVQPDPAGTPGPAHVDLANTTDIAQADLPSTGPPPAHSDLTGAERSPHASATPIGPDTADFDLASAARDTERSLLANNTPHTAQPDPANTTPADTTPAHFDLADTTRSPLTNNTPHTAQPDFANPTSTPAHFDTPHTAQPDFANPTPAPAHLDLTNNTQSPLTNNTPHTEQPDLANPTPTSPDTADFDLTGTAPAIHPDLTSTTSATPDAAPAGPTSSSSAIADATPDNAPPGPHTDLATTTDTATPPHRDPADNAPSAESAAKTPGTAPSTTSTAPTHPASPTSDLGSPPATATDWSTAPQPKHRTPATAAPATATAPLSPGDALHTVLVGIPVGGHVALWLDNEITYWRMTDPDVVRDRLGMGLGYRSEIDNLRFREAAMLSLDKHTLFLMDRFRDRDGHLGGTTTQLAPVTEDEAVAAVDDRATSELYRWLGELVLAAAERDEYLAVETGGWNVPRTPMVTAMLRPDGEEWQSVVETSPVPVDAPVWRDQQPVDGNSQLLVSPATEQTLRAAGLLTRFAVATWGLHPLRLCLSFGPNPTLGEIPTR